MNATIRTLAATLTCALIGALLLTGCGLVAGVGQPPKPSPRWAAVTALARADKEGSREGSREGSPAAAATQAADVARRRLGNVPARAVVFFECFPGADDGANVTAALQAAFPQAEIIGCSAAAVATQDGWAADNAVALLAIGGEGLQFSSAYAPATLQSSKAAGEWLHRQLGFATGETAMIVLADPATIAQPAWDANELLAQLAAGRAESSVIFGGLASINSLPSGGGSGRGGLTEAEGGKARIYHAGHAFTTGLAVLQIAGPLDWQSQAAQEQLRVGPVWQPRQVVGRTVGKLASGSETLAAQAAVERYLIAQNRPDGHVGRFVGELPVPLNFEPAGDSAIQLPVAVSLDDRLVLLGPAPAAARVDELERALASARLPEAILAGPPVTLLALPAGPNDAYVKELPDWQRELQWPIGQTAIAFQSSAQFVPVNDAGRRTCQFSNHLFGIMQMARTQSGPPSVPTPAPPPVPTTAPASPPATAPAAAGE